MPNNIRIIHAHDFIKATPENRLDLNESKKLLLEIAVASASLIDYDILMDIRKAGSEMSITDLWYLAAELSKVFCDILSRPIKTAVLCPLTRFNYTEFFALCAENRGFNVNAFTSFSDAYEWLVLERNL